MPYRPSAVFGPRRAAPILGCLTAAALACAPAAGSRPVTGLLRGELPDSARPPVPGAPQGVTAFVDVTVIPMDRERVLPHQTVLVRRGWIEALGPVGRVPVSVATRRIDGRGKFLLPGLSECHSHLSIGELFDNARDYDTTAAMHRLFLYLANGVTTVRNLDYFVGKKEAFGGMLSGAQLLELRKRAAAGELWSPRIYTSAAWSADSTNPSPKVRPESVATYVSAYKAAGYDFIKVRNEPVEILDSVAAAARRVHIRLVGHVIGTVDHDLALGAYASFEHLIGYGAEHAGALARAGVWSCPTLVNGSLYSPAESPGVIAHRRTVKVLQDSGAGILLGTDVPVMYRHDKFDRAIPSDEKRLRYLADEGAIHEELVEFVRAGLTPYQALVAGTRNMAAFLGTLDSTGTVEMGKRADLILLSGNPLQDIRSTERPAGVMIGGRWLPREELDRRIAAIEARYTSP